jgi:hypothetical protein
VNNESVAQKYGFEENAQTAQTSEIPAFTLGQRNPQHCPQPEHVSRAPVSPQPLGDPLSIHDVAALLGCSAWTVRQRYLPQGLPHLRACAGGRIVFFREQVVHWILKRQQQKGGLRK